MQETNYRITLERVLNDQEICKTSLLKDPNPSVGIDVVLLGL